MNPFVCLGKSLLLGSQASARGLGKGLQGLIGEGEHGANICFTEHVGVRARGIFGAVEEVGVPENRQGMAVDVENSLHLLDAPVLKLCLYRLEFGFRRSIVESGCGLSRVPSGGGSSAVTN
jgi:hypothetical protein